MVIQYKQKCIRCRTNYVIVTRRDRYPVCYDCQKNEMEGEITDPEIKKLFDIPEDYFKQNTFLRNIKINYLRYGNLSEKQIEAFKKVAAKIKEQSG